MNEKQSIIKFFQRGKVKYETTTLLTLYVRLQGILFAQGLFLGLLSISLMLVISLLIQSSTQLFRGWYLWVK